MDTMHAILLGLLQGMTEFLPVSSSAHLVAAQALLRVDSPGAMVEVALHFGTLLSIMVVFGRPLCQIVRDGVLGGLVFLKSGSIRGAEERAPLFPTALAVAIGTIPVAVAGVAFEEAVERVFDSLWGAGACLCVTGLILLGSRAAPGARTDRVGPGRGLAVGLVQALALLPGISRSGITITAGCLLGVARGEAARFSFLLAVPALAGALVWKLRHGLQGALATASAGERTLGAGVLASGTLVAALSGIVCLLLLLRVVERGRLHWFAAYCLPAGVLMMIAGALS